MSRLRAPDGTPLSVFVDGAVTFTFEDGTEHVETFENAGGEMELDLSETDPLERGSIESITFEMSDAKVAKSREVVEQYG